MKRVLSYLIVCACAFGCVYPYTPDTDEPMILDSVPVFEGNITVGDKATLHYTTLIPLNSEKLSSRWITPDFPWWVEDNDGNRYLPVTESPGEVSLAGTSEDKEYRIHAEYKGNVYESAWLKTNNKPTITGVSFNMVDEFLSLEVSALDAEDGSGYMAFSFTEAYEFHSEYIADYYVDTLKWKVLPLEGPSSYRYWCWKTVDYPNEQVADASRTGGVVKNFALRQISRSGPECHRTIVVEVKARSISEDEYKYKTNVDNSLQPGNNLFTPNPGELPGNISCISDRSRKALGYITISSCATLKRVFDTSLVRLAPKSETPLIIPEKADYRSLYFDYKYRPIMDVVVEGVFGVGWGHLRCVDCVAAGGTQTPPALLN